VPTLLLVKDELSLARIVQESLETRGFTVHHAANGEQVLLLFRTLAPDFVAADVMLPRCDDFELARQIRRKNAAVPIILLKCLFNRCNQVLTRTTVLQFLWGDDSFFNGRSLDVFITCLRRYLGHDLQVHIANIRGLAISYLLSASSSNGLFLSNSY
jgi:DNA-binding response OmpR family regulator